MRTLLQDAKYGLRNLLRAPGFAAVAVLTLALGIGANTTIFSVIDSTLLMRLPFPNAERLMLVWETFGKRPDNLTILSAPNFWDFEKQSHSFEAMAICDSGGRGYNLSASGAKQEAKQVSGLRVSADFFKVLGVKPLIGRVFVKEEETLGRDREVVLSYSLWQARYGGDPALLGRNIQLDGESHTVVGVMPHDFSWQFWSEPSQLWVPVGYTKTDFGRQENSFVAIARLKPGVSEAEAQAEVGAIAKRLARQYPTDNPNMSATVNRFADFDLGEIRTIMLTLFVAVAFVLVIGCVNVANLLLARGAGRQKEFAIRRALGAGGVRIARQLLTESLLLALTGGAAGLLLAAWSNGVLWRVFQLNTLELPGRVINSISINSRVFLFTFLVSCLTGVLFGIAPALSALRTDLNESLKEGGRSARTSDRNHLRQVLVAAEVALALIVLCGAGLMIKSMARLAGVDPGFDPSNLLVTNVSVPQEEIYVGPPGLPNFCRDIEGGLSVLPGVVAVGAVAQFPLRGSAGRSFQIEGRPPADAADVPSAGYSVACPNYFRTMGIPLLEGREFRHQDALGAPGVIVINEAMGRKYWPHQNPIGQAIRLNASKGGRLTVVGVTGDVHQEGLERRVRPQFFQPYTQAGWPTMSVAVRTRSAPAALAVAIKKTMARILPDRPLSNFETAETIVRGSTGSRRTPTLLLSTFALLALLLAAVGIVGVVSHAVAQRTPEIGIRLALGAHSTDVLRLTVSSSMAWILIGLMFGLAGQAMLTRLLEGLLYGVRPLDPEVLGGVCLILAVVGFLASYVPSRRATKIDPVSALRFE